MSTRTALVYQSQDKAAVKEIPLPKLQDEYILVKTKAVALNPTDWKTLSKPRAAADRTLGCDYAGIVEEVGSAVTASLKPGDRVAGFTFGGSHVDAQGAFATTVTAKGNIAAKIPDSLSFADAATLGVGITTVGQGLYQSIGLPLPPAKVTEPTSILIYGASTATGTLAVQFAKLSGCKVYATASPHNFDLLKRLGADELFDYKDPECGAKIRAATNDSLTLVFDTIAEGASPAICAAAISSQGGFVSALLPVKNFPREDVRCVVTLGYTALGVEYSKQFPLNVNDFEFGSRFWKISQELLAQGKIVTHPAEVRTGGLEAVPKGMEDLKQGKVSGVKLVYEI